MGENRKHTAEASYELDRLRSLQRHLPRNFLNPNHDQVTSQILTGFTDLVSTLDGDVIPLLQHVGIEPQVLEDAQGFIEYRKYVDLLAQAARSLHCPDFGMRLAIRQPSQLNTPLRDILCYAPTMRQALHDIVAHSYAHCRAVQLWVEDIPAEGEVAVGHDIVLRGPYDRRQAIEQLLLTEYLVCKQASRDYVQARRVEFRHQPISPMGQYRTYFGCEVRFDQPRDAIIYGSANLDFPNSDCDLQKVQAIVMGLRVEAPNVASHIEARVRGALTHMFANANTAADVTQEGISTLLGMHSRTLHRRLRDAGTSFQKIKTDVRCNFLRYYLENTHLPISDISERLGFAEQSALTRFCRQHWQASPRQLRESMKISGLSENGKS